MRGVLRTPQILTKAKRPLFNSVGNY